MFPRRSWILAVLLGCFLLPMLPLSADAQVPRSIRDRAEETVRDRAGDLQRPDDAREESAAGGDLRVTRIELPPEDRSWESDPSVREMKEHYLVGKDLWSAGTDRLVQAEYVNATPAWFVAGRPDLLLYDQREPARGFAHAFPYVAEAGTKYRARRGARYTGATMELCLQSRSCREQAVQARGTGHGPFLASDYRRVVYLQEGDLWRGDVNWQAQLIENPKRVTHVGVLGNPTINRWPTFLHWHGNTLFLKADLDRERPILRVDLLSGDIQELATMGVFEGRMFANPAGSRLCAASSAPPELTCYDVPTGRVETLTLPLSEGQGPFDHARGPARDGMPSSTFWVDDETLVTSFQGMAPHPRFSPPEERARPGGILRVDFRRGVAEALYHAPLSEAGKRGDGSPNIQPHRVEGLELLPGSRHLALDAIAPDGTRSKVRVAVEDGSVVSLPSELPPGGIWIDAEKYLFPRARGGLSEIGTHLHDLATGVTTRVCQLPADMRLGDRLRGGVYIPERNALYLNVRERGMAKADLATGECGVLATGATPRTLVTRIQTPPVDLRLDVSGDALWR